ncbi:MAG: DUF4139 domain-containing protein [Bacteroidales bacterium]|nr:DUF4139 domain-containing protein [Bacteroidales bacterium]
MKFFSLLVMATLCSSIFGQSVSTKVDHVTIYRKGALVNRTGQIDISRGTTTHYIENISSGVDPNSIRVALYNSKAKVLSIEHEYSYSVSTDTVTIIKEAAKRRAALADSILNIESRLSVLNSEMSLLLNNSRVGSKDGTNAQQLSQMVTYQREELTSIRMTTLKLEDKKKEFESERNKLLAQVKSKSLNSMKMTSRVKLSIQSDIDIANAKITLDYLVYDASWYPTYDIRIKDTDKPLKLGYMARVSQSSNEDWKNVKLTLSTGNPVVENVKPEFNTMIVGYSNTKRTSSWDRVMSNYYIGRVIDSEGKGIEDVKVESLHNSSEYTFTDKDGFFGLNLSSGSNLWFSRRGYNNTKTQNVKKVVVEMTQSNDTDLFKTLGKKKTREIYNVSNDIEMYDSEADESREVAFEEIEEMEEAPTVSRKSKVVMKTNVPLTLEQTLSSTDFAIDLPYTIPSGAVDFNVNMLTYDINADYIFSALPRMSNDIYLVANIPNSYNYSLQKGNAKIYLNNVFEGETTIDPDAVQDTLTISVGRDKSIAISREEVVSNTSHTILRGNRIEKTFEIVIKNNKKQAVHIEVIDQYPISEYKDVKITLTESSEAEVDAETGKLLWNIKLQPQEQRKLRFSYEIKCPKNRYNFKFL